MTQAQYEYQLSPENQAAVTTLSELAKRNKARSKQHDALPEETECLALEEEIKESVLAMLLNRLDGDLQAGKSFADAYNHALRVFGWLEEDVHDFINGIVAAAIRKPVVPATVPEKLRSCLPQYAKDRLAFPGNSLPKVKAPRYRADELVGRPKGQRLDVLQAKLEYAAQTLAWLCRGFLLELRKFSIVHPVKIVSVKDETVARYTYTRFVPQVANYGAKPGQKVDARAIRQTGRASVFIDVHWTTHEVEDVELIPYLDYDGTVPRQVAQLAKAIPLALRPLCNILMGTQVAEHEWKTELPGSRRAWDKENGLYDGEKIPEVVRFSEENRTRRWDPALLFGNTDGQRIVLAGWSANEQRSSSLSGWVLEPFVKLSEELAEIREEFQDRSY